MLLTAARLRPAIEAHAALVDLALATIFPEPGAPMNLDGLENSTGPGEETADILLAVLNQARKLESFVSFLGSRGVELVPPGTAADIWDAAVGRFDAIDLGEPEDADFDFDALSGFASRAKAFRCRILVGGATRGSGAFVSPRLVLTAAHVISEVTDALQAAGNGGAPAALPALSVKASDGQEYPALYAWHLPVHADELNGELPPAAAAGTHCDVALLRVMLPLGQSYGRVKLPEAPPDWTGTRRFALVHYPDGHARGFCPGKVRRNAGDTRLPHDVDTVGGSSGGPGFDRDFTFLGLHQGRMQGVRRLVPFSLYAANDGFRDAIGADRPPRYLWSLDGDIEGPIIIGRRTFFTGLAAMLDEPESKLRGIWVRRLRKQITTGLSFSFEMLKAFLARQEAPDEPRPRHVCVRVPTALGADELITPIARFVLGEAGAEAARPGVRRGETSRVAEERDRAEALASALDEHARRQGQTLWFFFEEPPDDELGDAALVQFEHLVEWFSAQARLRVVLAGFEQYTLAPLRFQHTEEARTARQPGLLVDQLGTFTREDLRVTLREALRDLNNETELDRAILDDMAREITNGMNEVRAGAFDIDDLGRAVERTRERVKFRMGLA